MKPTTGVLRCIGIISAILICLCSIVQAAPTEGTPTGSQAPFFSKNIEGEIPDWMARWELAQVLSFAKRYDESVAEYRKVIKKKPALYKARVELANVLFWSGKPDEALQELQRVPADTIDEDTKILLADLYRSQKNYQKAEPLYVEYLKTHPGDHQVRLKLAEMLSWLQRYDESLSEYETILKAQPDDIQVRRKYAFVLRWAGRYSEAIEELRKTLKE